MELNEPLSYEDKRKMFAFFFESEEGELFRKLIEDMRSDSLKMAESAYLKLQLPNEQIAANVNRASGIKAVIDFIDSIEVEVKERRKEEQK